MPKVERAASAHPTQRTVSIIREPRPLAQPTINNAAKYSLRGIEPRGHLAWTRCDDRYCSTGPQFALERRQDQEFSHKQARSLSPVSYSPDEPLGGSVGPPSMLHR